MRVLTLLAVVLLYPVLTIAQSPHGKNFNLDCSDCHVPSGWNVMPEQLKFNHSETPFTLTGQHAAVSCRACHKSLVFSQAPTLCRGCHPDVHQNSVGPDCAGCHTTTTWIIPNENELHQRTRFPLVGAHQNLDCSSCHSGYSRLYFPPINVACMTCHSKDYYAATSPNHVEAGFSTQCQQCHSVSGLVWAAGNFDHSFFPLVGGHNIQNSYACHARGNNFKGLSTDCYTCHSSDFVEATDPNHVQGGFPHDCSQCHTVNSWGNASFDHSKTGFLLTAGHSNLQCSQCHASGYTNTPTACVSCHQSNYQSTTNPGHAKLGLSTDCGTCHTTNQGWKPATFPAHSSYFVIAGAHTTLSCDQCHNGNYNTTPSTCYGCHQKDYDATTNPAHQPAGFATDCTQCHTQTAWSPSTFDHTTFFPLTGSHNVSCTRCHINSSNFAQFSCTNSCHSQASTDPHHTDVRNYVYSPTSCYSCHANGKAGDD